MEYKITTRDESQTLELAQNIASERFPNMIICLSGDLGSGKTVFTKGLAISLGIDEIITSPTFNIIKEYNAVEMPLFHMDVYRLNGDITTLGLEEYFNKDGIVAIEWADTITSYLPKERLEIKIKVIDEDTRIFVIKPYGKQYEDLCEAVL